LTPLVDRSDTMGLLTKQWRRAQQGEGQTLLILGEPGIGKSRLTKELSERATAQPHIQLWYQCSPYYNNTALFPFIDQLSRAANLQPGDTLDQRLEKLDTLLSQAVGDTGKILPVIAGLLGLSANEPETLAGLTPERRKEITFAALIAHLEGLAAQQPLLLIFEDVHWIDPSSLKLTRRLSERAEDRPMLIVLTARPELLPTWIDQEQICVIKLERLESDYGRTLIERVAGTQTLSSTLLEQICERTDGVPLFIEELTKTVLETDPQSSSAIIPPVTEQLTIQGIPATLQDSLMARLDQLGEAKKIAQICAVIGRQFSSAVLLALIRTLPDLAEMDFDNELRRLVKADLLLPQGTAQNLSYSFRHALVRDVAYDTLLRRKRERLHRKLVAVLEESFEETVQARPELLAHHCTEARLDEKAVAYWLEAGRRAAKRSASLEAVELLHRGLALLSGVSKDRRREGLELDLRVALGSPLISTRGPGSDDVEANYTRALELCDKLPERKEHFEAHWGWWRVSLNHRIGRTRADAMFSLAERLMDPDLLLQAHHCQWATLFHLGDYRECCRHVEQGLALYDPKRHRHQAAVYGGHDAKVCGHGELALASWLCGYPMRAAQALDQALRQAAEIDHAGSWAHARDYEMILGVYRGDGAEVAPLAEQMIDFAGREGLPDYRERALFFQGWAAASEGDARAGHKRMSQALKQLKRLGTKEDLPMFLDLLAQIHQRLGENEQGFERLQEALAESERAGIRFWLAELHRRQAKLMLERSDPGEVEAKLRQATAIAREQGALVFELRATLDLASLHQRHADSRQARACLGPVYERFEEGLDTPELAQARRLLDSLD
jgi:predicted ATPase